MCEDFNTTFLMSKASRKSRLSKMQKKMEILLKINLDLDTNEVLFATKAYFPVNNTVLRSFSVKELAI